MICSASTRRQELVAWQEELVRATDEGRPPIFYVWAGSRETSKGHDCSGHIVWWCRQVGLELPRGRATSDSLFRDLEAIETPRPGDLALYGTPNRATHVMVVLGELEDGVCPVAGMSGGGSSTTSVAKARAIGAHHKRFKSHLYRRDFIGFRRLPLEEGAPA